MMRIQGAAMPDLHPPVPTHLSIAFRGKRIECEAHTYTRQTKSHGASRATGVGGGRGTGLTSMRTHMTTRCPFITRHRAPWRVPRAQG